jgi:hypothetical protein
LNWDREKKASDIWVLDNIEDIAKTRVLSMIDRQTAGLPIGTMLPALMKQRWRIDIEDSPVIVPPGFYKAEHH